MPGGKPGDIGKKQAIIITTVFVIGVAAFSTAYIRSQLETKPPRIRSAARIASTTGKADSETLARRTSDDYQIVGKRNIFARPKGEKGASSDSTEAKSGKSLPPVPSKTNISPLPSPFSGRRFGGMHFGGSATPASIAATGIVRLNGAPYVLLERSDGSESALVKMGESGLGYAVVSIVGDQVTVRGPRGIQMVRLGENKQEKVEKAPEPAKPAESTDKSKSGGETPKTENSGTAPTAPFPTMGPGDASTIIEMRRSRRRSG